MSAETLIAFLVVTTLSSFMPGPAVIFVMSQAAWRSPRAGMMAGLGIQSANALYFAMSGFGLAGVIAASATAFTIIKFAGAAYLFWLGLMAILQSFRTSEGHAQLVATVTARAYRDGVVGALGNPKSILYFLALLPPFIDVSEPVGPQVLVLGAIAITIDFTADVVYALAGGTLSRALCRQSVRRWFERGVGGVFIGLSAATALFRRAL